MKEKIEKPFGAGEIKGLRKSLGMTQVVFAHYMGVSVKTVEAWESGTNSPGGAAGKMLALAAEDPEMLLKAGRIEKNQNKSEERKMQSIGLVRVAAATPKLEVANTEYNGREILECIKMAQKGKMGILLLPELCITGYTCGDLFYQDFLYERQMDALKKIMEVSQGNGTNRGFIVILGFYMRIENNCYNCAAVIQDGKIKGIVPKMFMPNAKEFYEARWFASGMKISNEVRSVKLFGEEIPFGHLIFKDEASGINLGVEICEDLWMPISPGAHLALNGANIIFNPSASNETVGKAEYRKNLIVVESAKNVCGYVYASAGVHESTTDLVFSGHSLIAENGTLISQSSQFERNTNILYGDLDFERIRFERAQGQNFSECTSAFSNRMQYISIPLAPVKLIDIEQDQSIRYHEKNPFIPEEPSKVDEQCSEIFSIQSAGLAKRIEHAHAQKSVIGISGGLDSTLALLVAAETHKLIKRPASDIVAITMPGFGTTGKTYNNALTIMKLLGAEIREISIKDAVLQHFHDIGHDPTIHDVTYENSQARERTQILMDIANMENGLVIGTGDLSELALGWCTYNGDHMSMYGVNAGIPKTLVRFVIKWVIENKLKGPFEDKKFSSDNALLAKTLQAILDTPISPELLPPDNADKITQKTEDTIGPYILHDFFIFYTIRYGMTPRKLLYIAKEVFADEYEEEYIKKWMVVFYRRFFNQQFKRSCSPDGPKVGSISLSPRGDWRMPSDADSEIWLEEINKL